MELIFTGTFERSIDNKGRLQLPSSIRKELGPANIFLTPGTDHCLELHTDSSLAQVAASAQQSSAGSKNIRSFARLFYSQTEQCKLDSQGRLRIPKRLIEWAEIEKEIVLIGVGFSWEVWSDQRWLAFVSQHQSDFDRIHRTTFDEHPPSESEELLPRHAK